MGSPGRFPAAAGRLEPEGNHVGIPTHEHLLVSREQFASTLLPKIERGNRRAPKTWERFGYIKQLFDKIPIIEDRALQDPLPLVAGIA